MSKSSSASSLREIRFSKYHGLGNDYLVIDPRDLGILGEDAWRMPWDASEIQLFCDRHRGIGSDGILWGPILPSPGAIPALRIFNPDGSEAEKSGNGVRIFSRYLREARYVGNKFRLETAGGEVGVEFLSSDPESLIRVDMGKPSFEAVDFPLQHRKKQIIGESIRILGRTFKATAVSIGNPHCVIRLPKISEEICRKYGPGVEAHRWFPRKTNVQFVRVVDRHRIEIQIWERGAGYTLASGSSSCAAVAAAIRQGWVDSEVEVQMPGGKLQIQMDESGHLWMTGPVVAIARGVFVPNFLGQAKS